MNILLLEPFFTASHQQWAEDLQKHSKHFIELLTMPGRHWKWRMHGGALYFSEVIKSGKYSKPDLLLATDMLDVSTFKSLLPKGWTCIPIVTYFHENQLAYPWSETDRDVDLKRDVHYGWINYTTALASDQILFNSEYNRTSFYSALEKLIKRFPDFNQLHLLDQLKAKSKVLGLGLDYPDGFSLHKSTDKPVFLWNHRWEFDKNPEVFFTILFQLQEQDLDFELIVLGESYSTTPKIFEKAKKQLQHHILHWGYCASKSDYWKWLRKANLLLVTSNQEFFGLSVAEAVFSGCIPILPNRLSYPELIPNSLHEKLLYSNEEDCYLKLNAWNELVKDDGLREALKTHIQQFHWEIQAKEYDDFFDSIKRS